MKIFVYLLKSGIPYLEEYTDRRLLFQAKKAKFTKNGVQVQISSEEMDKDTTNYLIPGKFYAIEEDNEETKNFRYYRLDSFEVDSLKSELDISLNGEYIPNPSI